jgi:hypothetical protein
MGQKQSVANTMTHGRLEFIGFSDTIVIFSPDLQIGSYPWFLLQCIHTIERSFAVRLPLRGAISVGTAFTCSDPPIIIGPSFLEAYEYCEDQDWIGLLLAPSATLRLRRDGLEPQRHDFVDDTIPLRKKSRDNVLAYRFQNGEANFESPHLAFLGEMRHFAPETAKGKYSRTMEFIQRHYRYTKKQG